MAQGFFYNDPGPYSFSMKRKKFIYLGTPPFLNLEIFLVHAKNKLMIWKTYVKDSFFEKLLTH